MAPSPRSVPASGARSAGVGAQGKVARRQSPPRQAHGASGASGRKGQPYAVSMLDSWKKAQEVTAAARRSRRKERKQQAAAEAVHTANAMPSYALQMHLTQSRAIDVMGTVKWSDVTAPPPRNPRYMKLLKPAGCPPLNVVNKGEAVVPAVYAGALAPISPPLPALHEAGHSPRRARQHDEALFNNASRQHVVEGLYTKSLRRVQPVEWPAWSSQASSQVASPTAAQGKRAPASPKARRRPHQPTDEEKTEGMLNLLPT